MAIDTLLQQVVSGLATGGIYASLALALVMIYQATEIVNYAQGEMAMFSTYLAWSLLNAGLPYWVAFFATLALAFLGGLLIERLIVRPVEGGPILTVVIVCIGLLVILNSVAGWIYSYVIQPFPSPFSKTPIRVRRPGPNNVPMARGSVPSCKSKPNWTTLSARKFGLVASLPSSSTVRILAISRTVSRFHSRPMYNSP